MMSQGSLRKKCNKCYMWVKMLHFLKLCLKSISSHSESFWKKKLGEKWGVPQYLAIFHRFKQFKKFLQVFRPFWGAKFFFFAKVPQYWSSFLKKIHCIFFKKLDQYWSTHPFFTQFFFPK